MTTLSKAVRAYHALLDRLPRAISTSAPEFREAAAMLRELYRKHGSDAVQRAIAEHRAAVEQAARDARVSWPSAERFTYDDGGRAAAGYKGDAGDCVTRAIAIAAQLSYDDVYSMINQLGGQERRSSRNQRRRKSSARTGVAKRTTRLAMRELGWEWTPVMGIGTGCTVHLRREELPAGRIIVKLSKHICAVIDGVIHDTYDPSRNGTRCVYGYWRKAP